MLKVNDRTTRRSSIVFFVNFEYIRHIVLVFFFAGFKYVTGGWNTLLS